MPKTTSAGPDGRAIADDVPAKLLPRQRTSAMVLARDSFGSLIWTLPALLSAVLGVWRLTVPALWADELATWGAVRLSWDQLRQLGGAVDAVLTPYYAAMKVYTAVAGTSTAALRLPALVAIVATTLVVTALGRRLGGRWSGLVAGLLFAVLPVTSRYAQETRPYAIAMFAAALAVLCLIRLLENPGYPHAGAYAGAMLLAALSHPLSALLVLAGHAIAVLVRQIRTGNPAWYGTLTWLGAAIPGGLAAAALIVLGYRNRTQISWIPKLTASGFAAIPDRLFLSGVVGGIVLGLAVVATRRSPDHVAIAAAAFTPPLALLAAEQLTPIWVARYVLVAIPPLAALAGAAMLRFGTAQAVTALTLTTVLGFSAQLTIREPAGHSEDSAKVASVIGPRWRAGDVVVFPDTHPTVPWAPRDMYNRYLPTPRPLDVLAVEPQRTNGHFLATECAAASCLGDPPRIWLVRVDNPANPFADMAPAKQKVLRGGYQPIQRWSYPLVGIILLERKPAG